MEYHNSKMLYMLYFYLLVVIVVLNTQVVFIGNGGNTNDHNIMSVNERSGIIISCNSCFNGLNYSP